MHNFFFFLKSFFKGTFVFNFKLIFFLQYFLHCLFMLLQLYLDFLFKKKSPVTCVLFLFTTVHIEKFLQTDHCKAECRRY